MPAATQGVNGSPRIRVPIRIVLTGPIIPVCAVVVAPTRSMAIMSMSTGATVHAVALTSDSHDRARNHRGIQGSGEQELGDAEQARHRRGQPCQAKRS